MHSYPSVTKVVTFEFDPARDRSGKPTAKGWHCAVGRGLVADSQVTPRHAALPHPSKLIKYLSSSLPSPAGEGDTNLSELQRLKG